MAKAVAKNKIAELIESKEQDKALANKKLEGAGVKSAKGERSEIEMRKGIKRAEAGKSETDKVGAKDANEIKEQATKTEIKTTKEEPRTESKTTKEEPRTESKAAKEEPKTEIKTAKEEPKTESKAVKETAQAVMKEEKVTKQESKVNSKVEKEDTKQEQESKKGDVPKSKAEGAKEQAKKAVVTNPDRQLVDMLNRPSSFLGANDPLPTYLL